MKMKSSETNNVQVRKDFYKWLVSNKVCDKNKYIVLDEDNKIYIDDFIKLYDEISNMLGINIMDIDNYKASKDAMDLLCKNENNLDSKIYNLYLEMMNYFLKFEFTTYEKKYDINENIINYKYNNDDISNIYMFSELIYRELCKWPYMYSIVDNKNKYINVIINNGEYNMTCIPLYSNKDLIDNKLLKDDNKIKKVKLNLFLEKFDKDKNNHAVSVVLNPNFENDKVFINKEDAFWYYFPDLSNYWD